jgi:hypothetical protein
VREIERVAPDRRFVQVLLLAMGETLLGRRAHWPIYAAAESTSYDRHPLPVAPTGLRTNLFRLDLLPGGGLRGAIGGIREPIAEPRRRRRVSEIPETEGGSHRIRIHLAPDLAMAHRTRPGAGCAPEVPWIDRSPAEIVREHVRFTLQPIDAPRAEPQMLLRTLQHMGSDRLLLFSTDYPHWQFDADDVLPDGLSEDTIGKILIDNPRDTYPRLRDPAVGQAQGTGEREVQ